MNCKKLSMHLKKYCINVISKVVRGKCVKTNEQTIMTS